MLLQKKGKNLTRCIIVLLSNTVINLFFLKNVNSPVKCDFLPKSSMTVKRKSLLNLYQVYLGSEGYSICSVLIVWADLRCRPKIEAQGQGRLQELVSVDDRQRR